MEGDGEADGFRRGASGDSGGSGEEDHDKGRVLSVSFDWDKTQARTRSRRGVHRTKGKKGPLLKDALKLLTPRSARRLSGISLDTRVIEELLFGIFFDGEGSQDGSNS